MRHIVDAYGWTSADSSRAQCGSSTERGYDCAAPASIKRSIRLDAGLLPSSLLRDQPLEVELSHRRLLILRCSSVLVR